MRQQQQLLPLPSTAAAGDALGEARAGGERTRPAIDFVGSNHAQQQHTHTQGTTHSNSRSGAFTRPEKSPRQERRAESAQNQTAAAHTPQRGSRRAGATVTAREPERDERAHLEGMAPRSTHVPHTATVSSESRAQAAEGASASSRTHIHTTTTRTGLSRAPSPLFLVAAGTHRHTMRTMRARARASRARAPPAFESTARTRISRSRTHGARVACCNLLTESLPVLLVDSVMLPATATHTRMGHRRHGHGCIAFTQVVPPPLRRQQ
jgi:hypothetical protein